MTDNVAITEPVVASDPDAGVPEADRLFAPPTPEEAEHALRDLGWSERFVCTRMASARGNTEAYVYSLEQAAVLMLDGSSTGLSLRSNSSFLWVNLDAFVLWVREVIGDVALADVLEARLAERDAYNDKIETLRQVLSLRMAHYAPYFREDDSEENEQ